MSKVPEKRGLSDVQKAKHDDSVHQDSLLWSRVQVLFAIQTATLAGTYFLGHNDWVAAFLLTLLGLALTGMLWIIAERDQLHREQSRVESDVPRTEITPPFPLSYTGGEIIRLAILLLAYADLVLLLLVVFGSHSLWVTLPGLYAVYYIWTWVNRMLPSEFSE